MTCARLHTESEGVSGSCSRSTAQSHSVDNNSINNSDIIWFFFKNHCNKYIIIYIRMHQQLKVTVQKFWVCGGSIFMTRSNIHWFPILMYHSQWTIKQSLFHICKDINSRNYIPFNHYHFDNPWLIAHKNQMFNNKRYNSYFDYQYYHIYLLVEESDIC